MKLFLQAAGGALLTALTLVALQVGAAMPEWQAQSERVVAALEAQSGSALETQEQARRTARAIETAIPALRGDLNRNLAEYREELSMRLAHSNAILAWGMRQAAGNLALANYTLADAAGSVNQVTAATAQIGSQVSDALPLFLDCDHNADCLFNRYQGLAHGLERMARAGERAAPQLAESAVMNSRNIEGITADVHQITSRFTARRGFWGHLWDGVRAAGGLLRLAP